MVFIILAAICDALIDTLQHHWYKFRFKDKVDKQWWNPQISWQNKYNPDVMIVQLSDAWHLFKTIKIILWVIAVVTYQIIINPLIDILIIGLIRNLVFSIFYNKVFVK